MRRRAAGVSSDLEASLQEKETREAEMKQMQALDPYPTSENAKAKAESFAAVLTKAQEARKKLLAFNPKSLDDIPGSEFSEKLKEAVARVKALYPGEKALPKEFFLGFEPYKQYAAPEESTGELSFQLEALEYLFTQLAEAGGSEVVIEVVLDHVVILKDAEVTQVQRYVTVCLTVT